MTIKQILLKHAYPLLMKISSLSNKNKIRHQKNIKPKKSFYHLQTELNNGKKLLFEDLRYKKVLLVNTATDCGYTAQFDELQKLQEQFYAQLLIIGFPANDFKNQERRGDEEIAQFCAINFNINFPLAKKSSVVKGDAQHSVFQWLSNRDQNGWNEEQPVWNFSKFLIDEDGNLTHIFPPAVSPLGKEVVEAIKS